MNRIAARIRDTPEVHRITIHVEESLAEHLWAAGCISDDGMILDLPDEPTVIPAPQERAMQAYVIHFTTGEYSDREERVVCAYTCEETAKRHCDLANQWLGTRRLAAETDIEYEEKWRRYRAGETLALRHIDAEAQHDIRNPYDPELLTVSYTGGSYQVIPLVLCDDRSLAMMEGAAANENDQAILAMFADYIQEHGWMDDAAKFRAVPVSA